MATLTIELPEDIRSAVEEVVARGHYASASEYLADLIRQDQNRTESPELERFLLSRLRAGPPTEWTPADFDRIRQRVKDAIIRRRTSRQ